MNAFKGALVDGHPDKAATYQPPKSYVENWIKECVASHQLRCRVEHLLRTADRLCALRGAIKPEALPELDSLCQKALQAMPAVAH